MGIKEVDDILKKNRNLLTNEKAEKSGLCTSCWCYDPFNERTCKSTEFPVGYCRKSKPVIYREGEKPAS